MRIIALIAYSIQGKKQKSLAARQGSFSLQKKSVFIKTDFFYNLLRAVKISPYFLHFFTFFMDKTCFCIVLYKKSSPPYCFAFTKGALL